jgi:hypothetical protein
MSRGAKTSCSWRGAICHAEEPTMHATRILAGAAMLAALFGGAPASAIPSSTTEKLATYRAEIRRTPYGIPHIKASDWEGLGFGATSRAISSTRATGCGCRHG